MPYVLTLAVSLFIAMALIPPLARIAGLLKLQDIPDARKLHVHPIPRVGGIAVIAGVFTATVLWVPLVSWIAGFLAGVAIIAIFGVWDDRCDLDYRIKFFGQFLAATAAVVIGDIRIIHLPLAEFWVLPTSIAVPLTILVLVAITNAINLTDGLDGLAGGTTLLAVSCMALLAYIDGDQDLVIISLGLIGALFGFLRYNSFPARVFLGDTGSQFLGFSAAVLAIVLTQQSNTALSPALPMLLLGLPILDMLVVMTQRILEGRSPFKADRTHLHHRLLTVGLDHYEAVLLIYIIQTGLICSAFLLCYERDAVLIGIFVGLAAAIVIPLTVMQRGGLMIRRPRLESHILARMASSPQRQRIMKRVPLHVVGAGIALLLLGSSVAVGDVADDIGVAALGCLAAFGVTLAVPRLARGVVDRLIVYVTAAFAVFLLATSSALPSVSGVSVLAIYYGILATAVAIALRFSDTGGFAVSSLDFLVIVVVVLLTFVAGLQEGDPIFIKIALQLVVVFYACEVLLYRARMYWRAVQACSVIALCVFAGRALLG